MKTFFLMLIFIIFFSKNLQAQFDLPSNLQLVSYEKNLTKLSNENLEKELFSFAELETQKFRIILKVILSRNPSYSETVLQKYIKEKENFTPLRQLKALATISLIELKHKNTSHFFLEIEKELQKSKLNNDKAFAMVIANKLKEIGNSKSYELLKKYDDPNTLPYIRRNRLEIEMKGMTNLQRLKHCLQSVQHELVQSDLTIYPKFVAELSSIYIRMDKEICLKYIRTEITEQDWKLKKGSRKHKIYLQLIKLLEYRFENPDKPTNPTMNPEIIDLVKEIN